MWLLFFWTRGQVDLLYLLLSPHKSKLDRSYFKHILHQLLSEKETALFQLFLYYILLCLIHSRCSECIIYCCVLYY